MGGKQCEVRRSGGVNFYGCLRVRAAASLRATRSAASAEADTIYFGLTPVLLTSDLNLLDLLQAYLESATGLSVELVTRRTYQEISALLISSQLDGAWICSPPFLTYQAELELLAVPVWNGKPLYRSYLIADARREVSSIDDLAGDIHAFSDPDSNSGYVATAAELAAKGIEAGAVLPADILHLRARERGSRGRLWSCPERQR